MSIEFGLRLKELRLEKNLTQAKVAELLCTTKYTISGWELNKQEPSIEAILKLCDIFDSTPNYLLGYDDDENVNNKRQKDNFETKKQYNIS